MRNPSDGTYRARWIVPMVADPIHGGYIRFAGGQVVELGSAHPGGPVVDLGDVALLPGLVNAHTHLEFSDIARPLGVPGMPLPQWVAEVVRHRTAHVQDLAARETSVHAGLAESAQAGVVLVGDIATSPWSPPPPSIPAPPSNPAPPTNPAPAAPAPHAGEVARPEMVVFAEVLGLSEQRQRDSLQWAEDMLRTRHPGCAIGLSPHAPYSTPMSLTQCVVRMAIERRCPVAMHVAESPEELQLMREGRGPFRDALERLGVWREGLFPDSGGMEDILRQLIRAPRCLLVHGNYLSGDQMALLAPHPNVSIVYCPRTHAYFGHARYPLEEMRRHGLRVVLGTDSRASNPDLSVWNEARFLFGSRGGIPAVDLLKMMTIEGAAALGRRDMGWFGLGARPGMIALRTSEEDPMAMLESLLETHPLDPSELPAGCAT